MEADALAKRINDKLYEKQRSSGFYADRDRVTGKNRSGTFPSRVPAVVCPYSPA